MTNWMETATLAATDVYDAFLSEVVERYVLEEREGGLSEEYRKRIARGTHIDPRVVRLMAISGKGGWSDDPVKRARYLQNTNVTLLDHLLSVVRGSMMLAALDWLGRNPNMDHEVLKRRLRVIAALAFLHDLDKMLVLERDTQLSLPQTEDAIRRYGIDTFLATADVALSANQIRYLIEKVEASQAFRSPPAELPPREFDALTGYVALADKLDGIWLSSDSENGGLKGVIKRLKGDQGLHSDVLRQWRPLELFDPHHLFLLDELQRWLSALSVRLIGVPPLIEIHQDGRLFMLLPETGFERIVDMAINALCSRLPFQLELNISNRGIPSLFNGQPDHNTLRNFIGNLSWAELSRLFLIKAELKDTLSTELDNLLTPLGLAPRWPRAAGALITPFANPEGLDEHALDRLRRAAHLVLLLNLKLPTGTKTGLPDYTARETELLAVDDLTQPAWLQEINDDGSRRTLTALWIMTLAEVEDSLSEAVWGEEGLLRRWLEGTDQQPGFNRFITGRGAQVVAGVERHFRQLLEGKRLVAEDETAAGRCLFTDEPVAFDDTIDDALGLYGVRVSAFSGRDNRPEMLTSERSHTNVGPVSVAEHKLRAQAHERQGGRAEGVPTLISSPTTSGLFGGLGMSSDAAMGAMSIYDLNRQEIKKGTVLSGIEPYRGRYRMARLERMAEKVADQVNQLRMLLQACRRIGRPIHIFRGLPTLQRAFFYYDAMPRILADLIGGNSLRLEQIPDALRRLEMAQTLLESNGLGYDVLRLYATPATRFAAVCLAWCHLHDDLKNAQQGGIRSTLTQLHKDYLNTVEGILMNTQEGALVRLGRAAAGIQRAPGPNASANEEMLVFKICTDFANGARAVEQADEQSLINGIASELEINLVRKGKDKGAARKYLREGCLEVAGLFVREVWNGVLKQHPPTQRNRRILGSIYRMAFLQAAPRFKSDIPAAVNL